MPLRLVDIRLPREQEEIEEVVITDDITKDIKYSSMAVGGGKRQDCFLCTYKQSPIYKHITARIIKCPYCSDYLAVFESHFDQVINMPWLISISHRIGEKFFGRRFKLDFSNGEIHEGNHMYLHIRRNILSR